MKKSLSLLLAIAMVFGLFASVASAADSTLTNQQKFEALKAKKIFKGKLKPDGSEDPALDDNMTRAEAARIIALVEEADGIGDPDTRVVTEKPFPDVEVDAWYAEEVDAIKASGIIVGDDKGNFNPTGNVTVQELAVMAAKILGLEEVEGAEVEGAASWAAGYIQALIDNGVEFPTNYTAAATRGQLVEVTFTVDEIKHPPVPAKVSVESAKATGVFKVEVKLDKAVDTDKATLALTKGTSKVSSTTKWNDDKKSATLALDTRISAGEYTVTLNGIDKETIDKATFTFTAEDETVKSLEWVNASDTLPYSRYAAIEVRAENQYGEASSLGASNFTALVSGVSQTVKKNAAGNLIFTADVAGTAGVTQGNGLIPVTVYLISSNVTITKNFKVGTVPLLSKIEVVDVTYSNKNTNKLSAQGDTAKVALKLYDQNGNPLVKNQFVPYGTPSVLEVNPSSINPVITPFEQNLEVVKTGSGGNSIAVEDLFDDNDDAAITVNLKNKIDKNADFTVNIYGGTSSATATVSVGAANLATKIEIDTSNVTLAANDGSVVIPVIAYDANDNKLSAQDIADNAAMSPSRFTFTASNGVASIVQTGKDKGKLRVTFNSHTNSIYNSVGSKVYISGQINQSLTNTYVQTSINVADARYADRIVAKDYAPKAILGASDKLEFQLKDQYNSDIADLSYASFASANGQVSEYRVVVEVTTTGSGVTATPIGTPTSSSTPAAGTIQYIYAYDDFDQFNSGFTLGSTSGQVGKVTIKSTIQKRTAPAADFSDYTATTTRSFEAIKSDTKLTYSLETIGDLFAAQDKFTGNSAVTGTDPGQAGDNLKPYDTGVSSKFAKKLSVIAKDPSGDKVKLPENFVESITASDPTILDVARHDGTLATPPVHDGYIIGNKAGTATVNAVVYTNLGNTVYLSQQVTVKADTIVVDSIKGDNDNGSYADITTLIGQHAHQLFNKLIVKDQYGIEYENATISQYQAVLGVRYIVETVSGTGKVTINPVTGQITAIESGVKEFEITAVAPNGKSATFLVAED